MGNNRLNKTYNYPPSGIIIPTDEENLVRGEHFTKMLCTGCHGDDLGGVSNWFPPGPLGSIDSPNLTHGIGGIGQEFIADDDYVNAIRHGVDPAGKPIYMPSVVGFASMSDEDLGAIIAYLKTIPPVDHASRDANFSVLGKILIGAGMFGNLPVEDVSHATHVTAPDAGMTEEYGQYLVEIGDCKACHGQLLLGGPSPDPSVKILLPDLTQSGVLATWLEQDFIATMRTGITPEGHILNNQYMPWKEIGLASDNELKAMFLYLQSLTKVEPGTK